MIVFKHPHGPDEIKRWAGFGPRAWSLVQVVHRIRLLLAGVIHERKSKFLVFGQQYYSDSEDLFGDYDSILEDSSLLAKLDNAEQDDRWRAADQRDVTANVAQIPSHEDNLTDSIFEQLGDDLPPSQLHFQEQAKRSRLQMERQTSTPLQKASRTSEAGPQPDTEDATRRGGRARRSVAEQLKRTMLENAAAPVCVSRSAVLKEAVVSEEISVAMRAMETISAETTDLGPFFGLPSKVKELMHKLRGIHKLYGENLLPVKPKVLFKLFLDLSSQLQRCVASLHSSNDFTKKHI